MFKLAKIILFVITSLLITSLVYVSTVNVVLPKLDYNNVIKFDIAYLNYEDHLLISYLPKGEKDDLISRIVIQKGSKPESYAIKQPFLSDPSLILIFGESHPISFVIGNVSINGQGVDPKLIAQNLQKSGYNVSLQEHYVTAEPTSNMKLGAMDLYELSNNFITIDAKELNEYRNDDLHLRHLYFGALVLLSLLIIQLIVKKITTLAINTRFLVGYSLTIHIVLLIVAIFLAFNSATDHIGIILKNHLWILLLPLTIFLLSLKANNKIRYIALGCSFLFMLFIGIDHFVQVVFGTRFLYNTVGQFAGTVLDGLPFLQTYVLNYAGFFYVLSMLCLIPMFILSSKFLCVSEQQVSDHKETSKNSVVDQGNFFIRLATISSVALFLCSILIIFVGNSDLDHRYYNTIQVNMNGLFTDGDYKRAYHDYKPYTIEQLEYKSYTGLNLKKNVIVVLVESLACDMTYLCGHEHDYSPYMKQLARENIYFPNYYSNAFHTNGAIFAITTGVPYLFRTGTEDRDMAFDPKFYQYDLINKFHDQGYITAYYSPANLVLNKNKQLQMSKYDYLSSAQDHFYDQSARTGIFNSVSDEEMFRKILVDLKKDQDRPKFFMLTTISTHTPYITPWGSHSLEQAFAYSDYAIKNFIDQLYKQNYFDNGIVIVTGDHRGWGNTSDSKSLDQHDQSNLSLMAKEKVPFILINGVDHGVVIEDRSFSHTSMGAMLEYLMLSSYELNKYQINPLLNDIDLNKDEVIIHPNFDNVNYLSLLVDKNEDRILLDGDQTRFVIEDNIDDLKVKTILGYVSWLRE